MGEHDGHRGRMKQRFLRYGLGSFDDVNALELLLFYAMPQKDTNHMAHELLDTFGSLEGVFDASPEALKTVKGIKDNAVTLLRLVPAMTERYFLAKRTETNILKTVEASAADVKPLFMTSRDEKLYLICLDARMKVLDCREISQGSTVSVSVNMRRIAQIALGQNATAVIMAHNHTSGIALPSNEDVAVTLRVRQVLAQVGIDLVDHLVVAADEVVSMSASGLLPGD